MDSLPTNLRDLQRQLNAAIRAHRNLVGRSNLRPHDAELHDRVQAAERLIIRIYHAQKPVLAQYKKDCHTRSVTSELAAANSQFRTQATVDEVLEDGVRHHFCPSTLERLSSSASSMSPEKKRKVNFLALFDLVTPKLSADIADTKSPNQKRKIPLVNADFPLVGPLLVAESSKRLRGSAVAATTAASSKPELARLTAAAAAVAAATSQHQGILTRSSRRARGRGGVETAAVAVTAVIDKSPGSDNSDMRHQSDGPRFCCASCHQVLPSSAADSAVPAVAWCSACLELRDTRASGAIGLPPEPKVTAAETSSTSASSTSDCLEAVEEANKSLILEAQIWERNLVSQEQRRQCLVEKNCRVEKKLENLLAQFSKVNGM